MKRSFHHGSLKSRRVSQLLEALTKAADAGLTTYELQLAYKTTRASSDVSEARHALRDAGDSRWIDHVDLGKNENGARVFRYILRESLWPTPAECDALDGKKIFDSAKSAAEFISKDAKKKLSVK